MKIFKIYIENYRLLKRFSLDLEDELSLVIGKNNTGKTSILSSLERFLNQSEKNKFSFDDFNIDFKEQLVKSVLNPDDIEIDDYQQQAIKLQLFISYNEKDNLENVSRVMMDLDPENNVIVLGFAYNLAHFDFIRLRKDYKEFAAAETQKQIAKPDYVPNDLYYFLKQKHSNYFKILKKSFEFDKLTSTINENNFIDLIKEEIGLKEIINFKYISAKRDVTNKEVDKTLSIQTSRIYKRTESSEEQNNAVANFKDRLSETDNHLSDVYKSLFSGIIQKVKDFGGIKINESEIEIVSTLQHRELLEGNTTVVYKHDENNQLPEHYNGLGYMNLISMIFEIEILIQELKGEKEKMPSDINLLFIEEPEAHTHPQMQYVFIKNIKKLLKVGIVREDGIKSKLQYIISTHSSHIVADSDFNDIKYLKKNNVNSVISKNLKDLEKEYEADGEEKNYRFLKQYLTLNRAELFFTDKAIFIEGDTERILLPAMMKKVDDEVLENPLLSQNISIVEVGAHSHIFEKFIDFVGITKSIIITDIDCYYEEPVFEADGVTQKTYATTGKPVFTEIKCSVSDANAQFTSNNSLAFFHNQNRDINYYKVLKLEWKILRKNKLKKWVSNKKGNLFVVYQIEENGYSARSFEDAFFHLNKDFIINEDYTFNSLTTKYLKKFRDNEIDVFEFAEKAVGSKPSLAIEILLNSVTDADKKEFSNWQIPAYIKEGLLWLKKD